MLAVKNSRTRWAVAESGEKCPFPAVPDRPAKARPVQSPMPQCDPKAKQTAGGSPKPVAEVRIGRVKAAIWSNDTEGGTRHNVTFSRLYKDGEEWKSTQSFGRNDLLVLAKVADQAHSRIFELQQEEEPETES